MRRPTLVLALALTFLPMSGAQDRPILPPGPPPGPQWGTAMLIDALFMQTQMFDGGEVMFLGPPADEPDPKKEPLPAVFAKVDGKRIRAFGVDRKPLNIDQLNNRLAMRAAAVVVHDQPPDPFFLKVLNERSVVFVVPKKLYDRMAKAVVENWLRGWWNVVKAGTKENTGDHWIIEDKKIALYRGDKLDGYLAYKSDASDYPKTIDLTPDHGPAKGKTLKGIFELDGLTLTICYVSPATADPEKAQRPNEIGAKGTVTIVFRMVVP